MNCSQVNIPEVDNSEIPCTSFNKTDCIIFPSALTYFNIPQNSTVTEVINALVASLIDARQRITQLEQQ